MSDIVVNGVRNIVTLGDPFYGSGNFWDSNNVNPNDGAPPVSPEDNYPKARNTGCVSTEFEKTNLETSRVNNAALDASNQIKEKTGKEANWEWGAIIYELNGLVQYTSPPFTSEKRDRIDWQFDLVPDGAIVVGTIHSQPYDGVEDQRAPSRSDWEVFDRIMKPDFAESYDSKFQIDGNMLQYIVTNQDKLTRVYDRKDKPRGDDPTRIQCYLEAK